MSKKHPLNPTQFAMLASEGAWKPFKHLNLIIELLTYVVQGRLSRLMVFCPPRHGKSELISYYFLTWYLGMFPDRRVILAAHTARFARKWGRRCRDLLDAIGDDLFPEPVKLNEDSKSAAAWDIKNHKGGLVTAGVGGAILGEGANLFIIDDPTKDFRKANSKTHQQELNDWWFTSAKTRLEADMSKGIKPAVVGIWQRLHKKDLAGQILYREDKNGKEVPNEPQMPITEALQILRNGGSIPYGTWVICNLPALAEENDILCRSVGGALWPEQRGTKELAQIKKEMGSFRFEAVYQGSPHDPEGTIFLRKWFSNSEIEDKEIRKVTEKLPKLRYWDFASTKDGDFCCGMLSAWDGEYLYLIERVHDKYTASRMNQVFTNTTKKDGKEVVVRIEQEPGSMSKILLEQYKKSSKFRGYNIRSDNVRKVGDKVVRSFDLQALAEDDKIRINTRMFSDVVNEFVEFTGEDGGQDDTVDASSGCARYWKRPKRKVNIM